MQADYPLVDLKIPPHSIPAEQSVLGGLMIDNSTWSVVSEKIAACDFYRRQHQIIFLEIERLAKNNEPFDIITMSESLKKIPEWDNQDNSGFSYLILLANDTPSAANIEAYADIVKRDSDRRSLISLSAIASDLAFNEKDANELFLGVNGLFTEFLSRNKSKDAGLVHIRPLLSAAVELIEIRFASDGKALGLQTGFVDFDKETGGLQSGVTVIAARPGIGKSTLALNIATHYAMSEGSPAVAIFSLEMPTSLLILKLISAVSNIDFNKLQSGKLDEQDWARLSASLSLLAQTNIYIDDSSNLTTLAYNSELAKLKRDGVNVGMVVVDYLQLMSATNRAGNRVSEVTDISACLRESAKNLNIPVLALSQLNRGCENRPDKKPRLSDIRESGAIEQDATLILFIYRDEVYNTDSANKGIAELIIGKGRNIEAGAIIPLSSGNLGRCKFENMARAYQEN